MSAQVDVLAITQEMRARRVNNGKHTSPTLIAWADRIDAAVAALIAERDALAQEVERLQADGVHSCGPHCQRIACVLRRDRDALRDEVAALRQQPAPVDLEQFRAAVEAYRSAVHEDFYIDPSDVDWCDDYADRLLSIIDNAGKVEDAEAEFADWLAKEMPAGTVIGDPAWWANRIARQYSKRARQPAPVVPALPWNWPEDAGHENGNYECRCSQCGTAFYGHKRRVVCRACAKPAPVVDAGNWIAADDVRRLTREIDVALNGEAGAAPQASLCDIAAQVKRAACLRGTPLLAAPVADDARIAHALEWVRTAARGNVGEGDALRVALIESARKHLPAIEEAIAAYDPNCGARTVRVVDDAAMRELIEADVEYDAARRDWDMATSLPPEDTSEETWQRVADRFEASLMRRRAALARAQGVQS